MKSIIFDLDGTLIDSAQSILVSIQKAFRSCGLEPVLPLEASIIGPPLRDILQRLSPKLDLMQIEQLEQSFIESYDQKGCLDVHPFPGVDEMLYDLKRCGFALHIVTNKRAFPAQKILAHLGWNELFDGVYASDTFPEVRFHKSCLIGRLMLDLDLKSHDCCYVGDLQEDGIAAHENKMQFLWVGWGFGNNDALVTLDKDLRFNAATLISKPSCVARSLATLSEEFVR